MRAEERTFRGRRGGWAIGSAQKQGCGGIEESNFNPKVLIGCFQFGHSCGFGYLCRVHVHENASADTSKSVTSKQ